ncbi:MAG: zinc-dependent metalloprotease [Candidatus Neomarinimicrobiota bacterium]
MKLFKNNFKIIYFLFTVAISFSQYDSFDYDFLKNKKDSEKPKVEPKKNKNSYENLIQPSILKSGLFDYYWDKDKVKCYIVINRNQLDKTFLLNLTRNTGDAYRYHGSAMMYEFPFSFRKVGSNIQMIAENVKFRADKDSVIFKAIANNITESIFSTAKIQAISSSDSLILIDASQLFIFDFPKVSNRGKYILDKKNSYFEKINSFEFNSELDMVFHYKGKKSDYVFTLPNSSSMLHKYHLSISELPTNNYKPRLLDDRVGHFDIIYQDYSNMLSESPYVRYITRWNLEKKNPKAKFSEPKEPIVFWIENTVPHKFRKAFRDGILAWNKSFEKIGFKNAIVAKQMPDDAEWDPADVRYNTVRWMIQPGVGIAVGPSRANPLTGEIYDADVRVSSDWVRHYYNEYTSQVNPILNPNPVAIYDSLNHSHNCNYSFEKQNQMSFLWDYMTAKDIIKGTQKELDKFVYEGIVDLILHEVGHTLGLRHNFKASSMLSASELSDSDLVSKYNITASVMDYTPANILDKGNNFFLTDPGPYDDWAIEYAYSTCDKYRNEEECLKDIISKSIDNPVLAYGTDEDADECDPLISRYDMSSDPIEYYEIYLNMINEYWEILLEDSMVDGKSYNYVKNKFQQGLYEYFRASRHIYKFIGGIYYSRHHIGDIDKDPFIVVDAKDQRRAINFLDKYILSSDFFMFPPELLNKLAPTRLDDFEGTLWYMDQLDYPIHKTIKNLQTRTLNNIYRLDVISRIHNNELRFNSDQEIFTLFEMFDSMNNIIWIELKNQDSVNSFRRELQNHHIDLMINIFKNKKYPIDAQNLALESIQTVYSTIENQNIEEVYDNYTKLHLLNMKSKIKLALDN